MWRLFGGYFNHSIHSGQNILGEVAFDLMAAGQCLDVRHLGLAQTTGNR